MATTEAPTRTEAEDATKPKRQTWRDWIPPEGSVDAIAEAEPMLTRPELVDALHDVGEDVSTHDLRYWHTRGVLPYPTKRKQGRTTVAIYPNWYLWLVRELRRYQREGVPLDRIGPRLHILVEQTFKPGKPGSVKARLSAQRERAIEQEERYRAFLSLLDEIAPRMRKLAPVLSELGQCEYTSAALTFSTEDGRSRAIPIALTTKVDELASD